MAEENVKNSSEDKNAETLKEDQKVDIKETSDTSKQVDAEKSVENIGSNSLGEKADNNSVMADDTANYNFFIYVKEQLPAIILSVLSSIAAECLLAIPQLLKWFEFYSISHIIFDVACIIALFLIAFVWIKCVVKNKKLGRKNEIMKKRAIKSSIGKTVLLSIIMFFFIFCAFRSKNGMQLGDIQKSIGESSGYSISMSSKKIKGINGTRFSDPYIIDNNKIYTTELGEKNQEFFCK